MKLMVIWGSSRTGRMGGPVAEWVKTQAGANERFEVDFVDLRELDLPFYDQPGDNGPFSLSSSAEYKNPKARAWADRVEAADGFIIVTPEYNHAPPAVLKNALDWVGRPWVDKPVAFVAYGGIAGGARAVEQLRIITVELGLIQVSTPLHFPYYKKAFDEKGQPLRADYYPENIKKMFDELLRLHDRFQRQ